MPYIVASQTIPILAIAPIVVVGLGSLVVFGWTPEPWVRVSVIAAYLTFSPVMGAILGELPSSIPDGLGGAIINFNQYYALTSNFLWATNLVAAALGIAFFLLVVIAEKLIVRRPPEELV